MRILYFSHSFGSPTTTFIRNEISFFEKENEIKYMCSELFPGSSFNPSYLEIIPFSENKFSRKIRWVLWKRDLLCSFRNRLYANKINSCIKAFRPDIIHCHFAYESLMLLDNLDRLQDHKIVIHFHGYDASQMLRKKSYVSALKKVLLNGNVTPIIVSEAMRINLIKAGIDLSKSHLLRYGIDLDKFKPASPEKSIDGLITFLQVSSLVEKKGHKYTMDAFALFFKNNISYKERVKIIFTGDGPGRSFLEKYAFDLGLENNVEFIGTVNYTKAIELLNNANIFVHHSITAENGDEEGIPNAIIEAMAMELPVLSTFHAGIPELVVNGVNGLLCKEKDVKTFSEQIKEIINWNRLPENRSVVDQSYNMVKHNQHLKKIYEDLIYNSTVKN